MLTKKRLAFSHLLFLFSPAKMLNMQFIQLNLFGKARALIRKKLQTLSRKNIRKNPAGLCSESGCDVELQKIWIFLRRQYFPQNLELENYLICWSKRRQLRTLASCNIAKKKINVAKELDHPACLKWLNPLLYHEMCHAVLADKIHASHGKMKFHGPEFKHLERRHPLYKELNQWIRSGGWLHAVRSHRAREAHKKRQLKQRAA